MGGLRRGGCGRAVKGVKGGCKGRLVRRGLRRGVVRESIGFFLKKNKMGERDEKELVLHKSRKRSQCSLQKHWF